MFKIAIFADLHTNYPALKSILNEIDKIGVDRIINLGDAIALGPHPNPCLETLYEKNIESVMGNHEEFLVKKLSKANKPKGVSECEVEHHDWTKNQLTSESLRSIEEWNYSIENLFDSLKIIFLHSPYILQDNGFTRFFYSRNMKDEIEKGFEKFNSDVYCFGHTHDFLDMQSGKRYINPGSVGCHPYRYAQFSIIELEKRRLKVHHHQVAYDKDSVINDMIKVECT